MPDKVNNLQDMFLNSLRRTKTPVTMFLVKGVKLQGIITWFDNFSVLLRRDGQAQLIYKHAISTIMPAQPVDLGGLQAAFAEQLEKKKPTLLQEVFLTAVQQVGRAGDDVPGQRRHAAGRDRRLRPVLHAARARRPVPARLQARHLDRAARKSGQLPARSRPRSERLSVFNRESDSEVTRGARAVIALPDLGQRGAARRRRRGSTRRPGLAEAIGVDGRGQAPFPHPPAAAGDPVRPGQVERIADAVRQAEAELVIVDAAITPGPAEESGGRRPRPR